MSKILLVLISVCVICLSGCGQSAQDQKQVEKEKVKKKIMGDGNKPMPKLSDYKS